jgi:hypothetical protein
MERKRSAELAINPRKKIKRLRNDPLDILLRDTLRDHAWRSIKFVSSEKQQRKLAAFVLRESQLEGMYTDPEKGILSEKGAEYVTTYAAEIGKFLNEHRSYCINHMKVAWESYLVDEKKTELPQVEDLLKILRRDPDLDQKLFAWYWVSLMPKAAGSAKIWNEQVKYFGLLSSHHPPDKPNKVYITPSTEAFAVFMFENNREKWPYLWDLKKKTTDKIIFTKGSTKTKKAGYHKVDISKNRNFVGKWSKSYSGQRVLGGWEEEGVKKFAEYIQFNKLGRAKETTKAIEEAVLKEICKKASIKGKTWEEHRKATSSTKAEVPEVEEIIDLFDDDEIGPIVGV